MSRVLNVLQVVFVVVVVLALLVFLAKLLLPEWFWHPLGICTGTPHQQMLCKGYNSWSGILGSWITNSPQWVIVVGLLWFHHNCHEPGCWKIVRAGKTRCKDHDKPPTLLVDGRAVARAVVRQGLKERPDDALD